MRFCFDVDKQIPCQSQKSGNSCKKSHIFQIKFRFETQKKALFHFKTRPLGKNTCKIRRFIVQAQS